jgi:hypothetical protein
MPPPLPPEIRNAIIEDLREGRLSFEEIAAKRLGDGGKKQTVSKIANQEGYSRKGNGRPPKKGRRPKVDTPKPETVADIDLSTFGPDERLLLLDEGLSTLKAILPKSRYPKGMMEWTSALERLLEQRRKETGAGGDKTESDGFFEALEAVSPDIWAGIDASDYTVSVGTIQPQAMANTDLVDEREPDQES